MNRKRWELRALAIGSGTARTIGYLCIFGAGVCVGEKISLLLGLVLLLAGHFAICGAQVCDSIEAERKAKLRSKSAEESGNHG